MTDEMIMSELSKGYLALVGARQGYKFTVPSPDNGVDLKFCPSISRREPDGKIRWIDSDKNLDVQLKSTHRRRVTFREDVLVYDLEVKTFNDLVYRRKGFTPLYLVLLVMPDDHNLWLGMTPEELAVRECAYWWRPTEGTQPSANATTVRIEIPTLQRVTMDFISSCFVEAYGVPR